MVEGSAERPEFVHFEFQPAPSGRDVPEWMWGEPLHARLSVDDLAEVLGPFGDRTGNQLALEHIDWLRAAGQRKVQGLTSRPTEPVILTLADFTT